MKRQERKMAKEEKKVEWRGEGWGGEKRDRRKGKGMRKKRRKVEREKERK